MSHRYSNITTMHALPHVTIVTIYCYSLLRISRCMMQSESTLNHFHWNWCVCVCILSCVSTFPCLSVVIQLSFYISCTRCCSSFSHHLIIPTYLMFLFVFVSRSFSHPPNITKTWRRKKREEGANTRLVCLQSPQQRICGEF